MDQLLNHVLKNVVTSTSSTLNYTYLSLNGKVFLDRQRFDQGESISIKVETYGIKVYEHLARIC